MNEDQELNAKNLSQKGRPGILRRLSLFPTIVGILLAILMFKLSAWQWTRYLDKSKLVADLKSEKNAPALPLPVEKLIAAQQNTPLPRPENLTPEQQAAERKKTEREKEELIKNLENRKVSLKGRYDFEHQIYIQNRKNADGPGGYLLTPMKIAGSDYYLFVNRGFIPFDDREVENWGKYQLVEEEEITAVVQKPKAPKASFGPQNPELNQGQLVRHWSYEEISKLAKQVPYPLIDSIYLARLGPKSEAKYPEVAMTIQVPPSTHFGYTIEWALLGLLTLALTVILQIMPKRRRLNIAPPQSKYLMGAVFFYLASSFCFNPQQAEATSESGKIPLEVGISQNLDQQLDLDLVFTDEEGQSKALRDFFLPNRPTIIIPLYYSCPRLCSLTMNGTKDLLNEMALNLGEDYQVLAVSFKENETPELAKKRANEFRSQLKKGKADSWKFLTGKRESIVPFMEQLGFRYKPDGKEFSHAAGIMLSTPLGRLSRYFDGVIYPATEVRLSLIEASQGKIGSITDHVFLFCYRFDPTKGQYTLLVWRMTQILCTLGALAVLGLLVALRRGEQSRAAKN